MEVMKIKKMVTEGVIINLYNKTESINATAKEFGLSVQMVRKILIGAGVYRSKYSDRIQKMKRLGVSSRQIAKELNISVQTVWAHCPYEKCCSLYAPSENALKIRKCRAKKGDNDNE